MNILALGAHPDDIEFGCGGGLSAYAKAGHQVFLFVASRGEYGGDPDVRQKEQEESARIIGAQEVFWGGYADTEVPLNRELISKLEMVIKQVRPDMIFVNYFGAAPQDPPCLAPVPPSAIHPIPNFLFFEVP